MSSELFNSLQVVVNRFQELMTTDDSLKAAMRGLASAVMKATDGGSSYSPSPSPVPQTSSYSSHAPAPTPGARLEPSAMYRRYETHGGDEFGAGLDPSKGGLLPPGASDVPDTDLQLIEARCRMKAEGSRWAAARRRRIIEGADYRTEIEPLDKEVILRAKGLPECFLWMNHPSGPIPNDLSLFDQLADCFETMAAGVSAVRYVLEELESNREFLQHGMELLAESQSALRGAIVALGGPADPDQFKVYSWLRGVAAREHIFIERYMKVSDPAEPRGWPQLLKRIETLRSQLTEWKKREKHRKKLSSKIKFLAAEVEKDLDGDHRHDWVNIAQTIDDLIKEGISPSNRELRETLLPIVDRMPDLNDLPQGFDLVYREIARYGAQRGGLGTAEDLAAESTAQIQEASTLLAGRTLALIGGDRRADSERALISTFGLKELLWIETKDNSSLAAVEEVLAKPELEVVLLAVRWSSLSHDDIKVICERHNKLLVRLPTGYSPTQIAAQILSQNDGRLTAAEQISN